MVELGYQCAFEAGECPELLGQPLLQALGVQLEATTDLRRVVRLEPGRPRHDADEGPPRARTPPEGTSQGAESAVSVRDMSRMPSLEA